MRELNRVHLTGLRAVEATARLGSLKAAADELGVTPGAVSQQIQRTEDMLGRPLFQRSARGLSLTPVGEEVAEWLTRGMNDLATAVRLADPGRDQTLVVSVAPIFASRWLVWRLKRFYRRHPGIKVRIQPEVGLVDPGHSDIDLCIRVGRGPWPGVNAEKLLEQRVFPVCSARIADQVRSRADLLRFPVIREDDNLLGWAEWLACHGMDDVTLPDGPALSDGSLCLDMAMTGQGVYMAWETLASDAIVRGQIVQPFPERVETGAGYWLITPKGRTAPAKLRAFTTFLREEIARSIAEWRGTPPAG
ncbi:LysR family transcriptional regulator [Zhengella mangrovi]|uniref:LysR family transcriptional regulator n=1 Tax=Zhengella mangrovi TaxID=1982044 RepID=A0A2G1QRV5_9HYPH|nr:LysR substrate-binding domain-containing protein [Zhengella mangrovi]PHP68235.1 LysR family transcriptional regulator [Zhengella mangrovi]